MVLGASTSVIPEGPELPVTPRGHRRMPGMRSSSAFPGMPSGPAVKVIPNASGPPSTPGIVKMVGGIVTVINGLVKSKAATVLVVGVTVLTVGATVVQVSNPDAPPDASLWVRRLTALPLFSVKKAWTFFDENTKGASDPEVAISCGLLSPVLVY